MQERKKLTSKFIDGEIYYVDELGDGKLIPKSKFISYIKSTYLMPSKTYFDRVMEIRGESDYNKCCNCGSPTKFVNLFSGYSRYCSVACRNISVSKGNLNLVIVTVSGDITHKTRGEYLCKYVVPCSTQAKINEGIKLIELINLLESEGSIWISGYNGKSIRFAARLVSNMKLNNKLRS